MVVEFNHPSKKKKTLFRSYPLSDSSLYIWGDLGSCPYYVPNAGLVRLETHSTHILLLISLQLYTISRSWFKSLKAVAIAQAVANLGFLIFIILSYASFKSPKLSRWSHVYVWYGLSHHSIVTDGWPTLIQLPWNFIPIGSSLSCSLTIFNRLNSTRIGMTYVGYQVFTNPSSPFHIPESLPGHPKNSYLNISG